MQLSWPKWLVRCETRKTSLCYDEYEKCANDYFSGLNGKYTRWSFAFLMQSDMAHAIGYKRLVFGKLFHSANEGTLSEKTGVD